MSILRFTIEGNTATYHCKDKLKEIGLMWDPEDQVWWTSNHEEYKEAKMIVEIEKDHLGDLEAIRGDILW